jgi:hypothetical protein
MNYKAMQKGDRGMGPREGERERVRSKEMTDEIKM